MIFLKKSGIVSPLLKFIQVQKNEQLMILGQKDTHTIIINNSMRTTVKYKCIVCSFFNIF
jgi:hypothetical protein